MAEKLCPICGEIIDTDTRTKVLALDIPRLNLTVHRECSRLPDKIIQENLLKNKEMWYNYK